MNLIKQQNKDGTWTTIESAMSFNQLENRSTELECVEWLLDDMEAPKEIGGNGLSCIGRINWLLKNKK